MGCRVGRVDLVKHFGVRLQRAEPVGEASRHQKLLAAAGRELGGDISAVMRRIAAQIDRDVEDAPTQHADELGLDERPHLEMQSAHGPRGARTGLVVLDEIRRDAGRNEIASHVSFGKLSAPVDKCRAADEFHVCDFKRLDLKLHRVGLAAQALSQSAGGERAS